MRESQRNQVRNTDLETTDKHNHVVLKGHSANNNASAFGTFGGHLSARPWLFGGSRAVGRQGTGNAHDWPQESGE